MEKAYEVSFEIAGPTAMWTRSDTGATPISYPVPPWSAAKGLFESISRLKKNLIARCIVRRLVSPMHMGKTLRGQWRTFLRLV